MKIAPLAGAIFFGVSRMRAIWKATAKDAGSRLGAGMTVLR